MAKDARIRIASSCGYELWIDGEYVQRGPLRCPPNTFAVDEWPVVIGEGKHPVVLLAQRDGEPSSLYVYQPGRLLVELSARDGSVLLASDKSWRACAIPEWERFTHASDFLAGFSEHWVEKERPWAWPPSSSDTGDWGNAVEIGSPGDFGEKFEERVFPALADTAKPFSKLLNAAQADRLPGKPIDSPRWDGAQFQWRWHKGNWLAARIPIPENDRQPPPSYGYLADKEEHHPWPAHVSGLPATLPAVVPFPLQLTGLKGEDLCLLWDFGGSFAGRYRLAFSCESPGIVDITQGEVLDGESRFSSESSDTFGDRFEALPGRRAWRMLAVRAGRYVQITLRGFKGEVAIDSFCVEEAHYPWVNRPSFECEDEALTRIFHASMRTSELCFDDVGMDCPHRERAAWGFDGWFPAQAIFFGSGDARPWRRAMELQATSFDPNRTAGPLRGGNPADHEDAFPFGSLFYLHEVAHYYRCTGDKALVKDLWPVLRGTLAWYRRFEWQGLLRDVPGRHFYEWTDRIPRPPLDRPYPEWRRANEHLKGPNGSYSDWDSQHSQGSSALTNGLYIRALKAMAELAAAAGDSEFESKIPELISATRQAFRRDLWIEDWRMFADRADDAGPVRELSEIANVYALWADILPKDEALSLIARLRDPARLMIRIQSPYTLHHYVYGLAHYGQYSLAVDLIKWAYLHHLDNGGDTLGERFPVGSSMIHGVNGFIAVWILECCLGLKL
ncbi:MAG: hypothetical protein CVU38_14145 [Chloroflexi bacterium HGW-Chloroflexi-1]|nr:MAG: hypothetical protein CVU38_14145 [Chloroflexi bacterium HGW-Chloroflexi-1]